MLWKGWNYLPRHSPALIKDEKKGEVHFMLSVQETSEKKFVGKWNTVAASLFMRLCCMWVLVELKGCRLCRQRLAAFMWVELTGSRAVKLPQGMCFSGVDRWHFFFPLPLVICDTTGSLERTQSKRLNSAGQGLACCSCQLAEQFLFVWDVVCGTKIMAAVKWCSCDLWENS